jgi:hypothetical protein
MSNDPFIPLYAFILTTMICVPSLAMAGKPIPHQKPAAHSANDQGRRTLVEAKVKS